MKKLQLKHCVFISMALSAIGFLSILLIPLVEVEGTTAQRIGSYVDAGVFWLSIVAQIYFLWLSTQQRIKMQQNDDMNVKLSIGVISFFKNLEGKIADIILGVSFITIIIFACVEINSNGIIF